MQNIVTLLSESLTVINNLNHSATVAHDQ